MSTSRGTLEAKECYSTIRFAPGNPDALCEQLASEVAEIQDVTPADLNPVHNVVDLEALAGLFESRSATQDTTAGYVAFSWEGLEVTVRSDGEIQIRG